MVQVVEQLKMKGLDFKSQYHQKKKKKRKEKML
jgi:hypothetical protein